MSEEERLLDEALYYSTFALAFTWTPDQVDDQPALLIDRMLIVMDVRGDLMAEQARRNRGPTGG